VLTARFQAIPDRQRCWSLLQLLAAPIGLGEIIIGQLTPLLLDLAFGCLPVSFDAVPIHFVCDLPKLNGQSTAEQSLREPLERSSVGGSRKLKPLGTELTGTPQSPARWAG
jgi:hypothetical protein